VISRHFLQISGILVVLREISILALAATIHIEPRGTTTKPLKDFYGLMELVPFPDLHSIARIIMYGSSGETIQQKG